MNHSKGGFVIQRPLSNILSPIVYLSFSHSCHCSTGFTQHPNPDLNRNKAKLKLLNYGHTRVISMMDQDSISNHCVYIAVIAYALALFIINVNAGCRTLRFVPFSFP